MRYVWNINRMTENLKQNENPSDGGRGPEILFYAVTVILFFGFRYGLSFSAPFALFLAIVIDMLVAYPLFIQGKSNEWLSRKRPWTFLTWLIPTFLIASGFYLAYWILGAYYPW